MPEWRNTFANYQPPKTSGMYLSERDRFEKSSGMNTRIAFQKEEREMKNNAYQAKLLRIQERQQAITDRIKNMEVKKEVDARGKAQAMFNRQQSYQSVNSFFIV